MEDFQTTIPIINEDETVITATQDFVKALEMNKNLTSDMRKILEDLNIQLSNMNVQSESRHVENPHGVVKIEKQLSSVEETIIRWESDQSMIWEAMPEAASEYLHAVDEVRKLVEILESTSLNEDENASELLSRTHGVLQMAMARLEEEFKYVLYQRRQSFEPEHMSFRSCDDDLVDEYSSNSIDFESVEDSLQRDSSSRISEDSIIDLVHPDVVPDLKSIANVMIASNYDQECCQAYISTRKEALDECLSILQVEKMSIEDVMKMGWSELNRVIKKWIRAMKIFTRVYLAGEKRLCQQIFMDFGSMSQFCFVEASKPCVLRLLCFAEAIAVGPLGPEKLFRILDMYEVLSDLLPEIDILFPDEVGSFIKMEYHEVLKRLGDSVIGTFSEFENAIRTNTSTTPFAGGGIHHLTKYVMNYIKFLTVYSDTLNFLLQGDEENSVLSLPRMNSTEEENESDGNTSSLSLTPIAHRLRLITSILESNLKNRSNLYRDIALQHFFLMNNICYMVQKVQSSELQAFFGDDWIRQHIGRFQLDALNYERATWNSILSLLKEDGIYRSGSNSASKTILKERFRSFNTVFEEVYKNQTGWLILDPRLREDLRISVSLKIIQAYRTFLGRHLHQLDGERHTERYIKYTADDLENYLLDFFEGSQRSLHNPRKK